MISRLREVLTLAALAVLTSISVASAVYVARHGLHEPQLDANSDLFTLVSTASLLSEPVEKRMRVVRRLEAEFARGVAWRNRIESLDDEAWEQTQANFAELTRLWLLEKARNYHEIPQGGQREDFFRGEAKIMMAWGAASLNRRDRTLQRADRGRHRQLLRVPDIMATGSLGSLGWQSNDEADSVKTFLADALSFFTNVLQKEGGLNGIRAPLGAPGGF
ncbi:MAG: hypothetical protein KF708_16720 [Pirellulales bacterium]|nr:hypothetical protein [Pirellulales bacterium]